MKVLRFEMMIKNSEIAKYNNDKVEALAVKLATESPELKDLDQEQLEQIAKIVITKRLTEELDNKAKVANIDYKVERDIFLMTTSKTGSRYTKGSYRSALDLLEKFCKKNSINMFMMTYAQADDFIYSLTGSPNSKRLTIAAISSFFSYLERRYLVIQNPIRGTKARPTSKNVKELEIPDEIEVMTILNEIPELEKMAVYIMAYRGLRVGGLNKLKVWGNHYKTVSKGKSIQGEFPVEVICNIKVSMLDKNTPFSSLTTNALKLRIYRATMKLQKQGKIRSAYSAHDFRHFYAISEYQKDKDIYKLSKLLDHSNIAITETYLKSLKFAI
jgi:site-specific recombinase XerD